MRTVPQLLRENYDVSLTWPHEYRLRKTYMEIYIYTQLENELPLYELKHSEASLGYDFAGKSTEFVKQFHQKSM